MACRWYRGKASLVKGDEKETEAEKQGALPIAGIWCNGLCVHWME